MGRAVLCAALPLLILSGCGEQSNDTSSQKALPNLSPEEDPFKKGHLPNALTSEQGETLALGINASGNLCAEVIGAVPDGDRMLVECKEYRTRKPETFVRYWISGLQSGGDLQVRTQSTLTADGWK